MWDKIIYFQRIVFASTVDGFLFKYYYCYCCCCCCRSRRCRCCCYCHCDFCCGCRLVMPSSSSALVHPFSKLLEPFTCTFLSICHFQCEKSTLKSLTPSLIPHMCAHESVSLFIYLYYVRRLFALSHFWLLMHWLSGVITSVRSMLRTF